MKTAARLLLLHALTPLHPGTGQTTGVVDLPVQREVHTGFPTIAATGLKGSLRDVAERLWNRDGRVDAVFGPPTERAGEGAGALVITDARILLFPVRSFQHVFVWVTCPLVIRRLRRDLDLAGLALSVPEVPELRQGSALAPGGFASPLVLEEMPLALRTGDAAWQGLAQALGQLLGNAVPDLNRRLVVAADQDFAHLVQRCTQVSARVALNDRKTTTDDGGNLWYEETLPPETVFYTLLLASEPRVQGANGVLKDAGQVVAAVEGLFRERPYLQVGGNETVGQGWCRVIFHGGGGGR